MSSWDKKEAKRLLQKLLFYVLIEKTRIKHLKNRLLHNLPLIVIKYCKNIRDILKMCKML